MEIKKNILIVEDEAIHVLLLKILLQKNGYNISGTAASGEKAIHSVKENCPDLVLMDINLQDSLDGIQVANILREDHKFPIIFVSAFNDKDMLSRISEIENSEAMTKPVDSQQMLKLMKELLST